MANDIDRSTMNASKAFHGSQMYGFPNANVFAVISMRKIPRMAKSTTSMIKLTVLHWSKETMSATDGHAQNGSPLAQESHCTTALFPVMLMVQMFKDLTLSIRDAKSAFWLVNVLALYRHSDSGLWLRTESLTPST